MDPVTVTIVRKADGPCTKRIFLGPEGKPIGDSSGCAMSRGEARRVKLDKASASALADLIGRMTASEALILGDLADGLPDEVGIDRKNRLAKASKANTIARTRDRFVYRAGIPAFVLLDHDVKGMPPEVQDLLRSLGGFHSALEVLLPGMADAGQVIPGEHLGWALQRPHW